jgi:hypothetical protein
MEKNLLMMLKVFSNIDKNALLKSFKDYMVIKLILLTIILYTLYVSFIYSLYNEIFNANMISISTKTHNHIINVSIKLNDVTSFLLLLSFLTFTFILYILNKYTYLIIKKTYENKKLQNERFKIIIYVNDFINKHLSDHYYISDKIFDNLMNSSVPAFGKIMFFYDEDRHDMDIGLQLKRLEYLKNINTFFEYE